MHILVINGGSSSIKFSIFEAAADPHAWPGALFTGEITGIGTAHLGYTLHDAQNRELGRGVPGNAEPVALLQNALNLPGVPNIDAVGYRVVHPGPLLDRHQRITETVLRDLQQAIVFAPLHDPQAIDLIRKVMARFPHARHYACFDTIFHQTMPPQASTYAIPASYRKQGVRRYGFHGLSCEGVVADMKQAAALPHRMVVAHLGSGCSLTALIEGRSVDNTMGLTPTGGVVMGTRPGDLDPGLVLYLLRQTSGDRQAALNSVEGLLNHQSGMVALTNLPNDMRGVRQAAQSGHQEARLALQIFTRSVRSAIGAFAWTIGGLDAIVFTGGIGEHDALSRDEILSGLDVWGVTLDTDANHSTGDNLRCISAPTSRVAIWVVTAQEDRTIAVHVRQMERESERQ